MSQVTDNAAASRFEMPIEGDTAFIAYRRQGNVVFLVHAEVPRHLGGRGHGARLVRATLAAIRAEGRDTVEPRCSFVRRFMAEHPEFDDLRAR